VTLVVDKIFNGGFEGSADPWILSGVAMRSTGSLPHNGTGYLILGGANGSKGVAYQQLVIPRSPSTSLTFWLNATSSDATTTPNDRLWIEVCDRSGRVLATLARFSNLDRAMPGNYTHRGKYNLARFVGQTVRIQFRTETDASSITSFRIDDVSVR
jgi:hypothetical protein